MKKLLLLSLVFLFSFVVLLVSPTSSQAACDPAVGHCTPLACANGPVPGGDCGIPLVNCCNNDPPAVPGTTFGGFCPPTGGGTGIETPFGCLNIEGKETISTLLTWAVGIGGGIAFLLIVYAAFMMTTAAGDPKRIKAAQELLAAAMGGLVLIVLSVVLLNFIGVKVLNLPTFVGNPKI